MISVERIETIPESGIIESKTGPDDNKKRLETALASLVFHRRAVHSKNRMRT
jgi:hypothetical protein